MSLLHALIHLFSFWKMHLELPFPYNSCCLKKEIYTYYIILVLFPENVCLFAYYLVPLQCN